MVNKNPIKGVRSSVNRKLRRIKKRTLLSALRMWPSWPAALQPPRAGPGGTAMGGHGVMGEQARSSLGLRGLAGPVSAVSMSRWAWVALARES